MIRTKFFMLGSSVVVSLMSIGTTHAQSTPVDWSGVYGGAFGEYSGGQSTQNDNGYTPPKKKTVATTPPVTTPPVTTPPVTTPPVTTPPVTTPPVGDADGRYGLSGGIGGGLVGYNYQFNRLVIGAEGDIGAGSVSGSSSACGTTPHTCGTRVDALADIRGRLGYAFGNFLPFVAGGAAFANLHAYDSLTRTSGGAWRSGYTIGGGLEYKISPRIALRVEYLHARFDSQTLFDIARNVPERIGATNEIVRVGVSFYLAPPPAPVVAKY